MGFVSYSLKTIIYQINIFLPSPNVWSPMMHMIIFGLKNLNDTRTSEIALKWANRWVRSNYIAYVETDGMYEKYIATEFGAIGGGKFILIIKIF